MPHFHPQVRRDDVAAIFGRYLLHSVYSVYPNMYS
jgi:hypothetical protein